jgi:hypothetical protein
MDRRNFLALSGAAVVQAAVPQTIAELANSYNAGELRNPAPSSVPGLLTNKFRLRDRAIQSSALRRWQYKGGRRLFLNSQTNTL